LWGHKFLAIRFFESGIHSGIHIYIWLC
jgi:hypothetical protein